MYKVLIADDEPRIRRGLRKVVRWQEYGMEVVDEASDGRMALEKVKALEPDLVLLDICMPFLNGLDLIKRIREETSSHCLIIIITGYDDFEYARRALRLQAFDFLLKPVSREKLHHTITNAKGEIQRREKENHYQTITQKVMMSNQTILINQFFLDWLRGRIPKDELKDQLEIHQLNEKNRFHVLTVFVDRRLKISLDPSEWEKDLVDFAVTNIITEILESYKIISHIRDKEDYHLFVFEGNGVEPDQRQLTKQIEEAMHHYIGFIAIAEYRLCEGVVTFPEIYKTTIKGINNQKSQVPVVQLATRFIHNHYNEEISLQVLADEYKISATYLSRLMKKETGVSFIDYVTKIRIKKAKELMKDPTIKLYEIAEKVGYNSQHYFSTAFKKVMGYSPLEHRKKLNV